MLSFFAGCGLGWVHNRMYQKMLESLWDKPLRPSYRFAAIKAGLLRHILAFAAGVLLIREAELDPIRFCGGFLMVLVVYRVTLFRGKGFLKEARAQ